MSSVRRARPGYVTPLLLEATECGWSTPCQCPYHRQLRPEEVLTAQPSTAAVPEMNCLRLAAQDYALARMRGDVGGMLRTAQMLTVLALLLQDQAIRAWHQEGQDSQATEETLAEVGPPPILQLNA